MGFTSGQGGYKLELVSTPIQKVPPRVIQVNNSHLIMEEVDKLLSKGAIKIVPLAPTSSLAEYLLSQRRMALNRLVINLRPLNQF